MKAKWKPCCARTVVNMTKKWQSSREKEHRLEAISQGQSESGRPSPTVCKLSPQQQPAPPQLAPQSKAGKQATGSETREVNPMTPPTRKHTTDLRSEIRPQVASFSNAPICTKGVKKSPHCFCESSVPWDTPILFSKRISTPLNSVSILDSTFWEVLKPLSAYRKQGFLRHLKSKIYLALSSTRSGSSKQIGTVYLSRVKIDPGEETA